LHRGRVLTFDNAYRNKTTAMATKTPAKPAPLVIFIETLPLELPDDVELVVFDPVALALNAAKLLGPDSTVFTANTMPEEQ
jgi:hypothetical protein